MESREPLGYLTFLLHPAEGTGKERVGKGKQTSSGTFLR